MSRNDEIICLQRLKQAYANGQSSTVVFDNTDGAIEKALLSCISNSKENDFPDFLFDGGAIEHFLVGSSKEDKKGSKFKRDQRQEEAEASTFIEEKRKTFMSSPPAPGTITVCVYEKCSKDFSYEAFLKSIERNYVKHIGSLKKSQTRFDTVVFLMEQQTPRLGIFEYGVYRKPYLLSRDKRGLEMLAKYAPEVRYVIYFAVDVIEAIDLTKLPEMISTAEENGDIKGGRHMNLVPFIEIDI